MANIVLIRGGGDLASGVALRLHHAGIRLVITELEKPLAVRRTVSFAEAVYAGKIEIEGVVGQLVSSAGEVLARLDRGEVPVLIDPDLRNLEILDPLAVIDARMTKRPPETGMELASLVIGLGPGFTVGVNCHAVVETNRGHNLGRVFWKGGAQEDTGLPASIAQFGKDRVLRSPDDGRVAAAAQIGQQLKTGELIATIGDHKLTAPFNGVLRGLVHPSLDVHTGMKIGDIDPRNDPSFGRRVSDKSLSIGGGVLEALLTQAEIRRQLWND